VLLGAEVWTSNYKAQRDLGSDHETAIRDVEALLSKGSIRSGLSWVAASEVEFWMLRNGYPPRPATSNDQPGPNFQLRQ
jgi:hypothetical protein